MKDLTRGKHKIWKFTSLKLTGYALKKSSYQKKPEIFDVIFFIVRLKLLK